MKTNEDKKWRRRRRRHFHLVNSKVSKLSIHIHTNTMGRVKIYGRSGSIHKLYLNKSIWYT